MVFLFRELPFPRAMDADRVAALFAAFHRAAPNFAEGTVARCQRIVVKALSKIERPIIADSFQLRFDAHLRIVRRTLGTAVKKDIIFHFQPSNIFFETRQPIFHGDMIDGGVLVSLTTVRG